MKMNEHKIANSRLSRYGGKFLAAALGVALFAGAPLYAADPANVVAVKAEQAKTAKPKAQKPAEALAASQQSVRPFPSSTELVPRMELSLGQSHLVRLPEGVILQKVKVDDEKVVQVEVTSPREVVIYAKTVGSTSVIIWDKTGQAAVVDVSVVGVTVAVDAAALQSKLRQVLPGEKGIKVSAAADSLVLSGTVTDAVKADKAVALAEAYEGKDKKKVINMLQVAAPQQVMLEVKIAEVSKTLLDDLGAQLGATAHVGGMAFALASGFLSLGATSATGALLTITDGKNTIKLDAQNKDGIVKILAEPNIMAISGQEGSFLAGGTIFIPVPQSSGGGVSTITLEEKEFGVGLKFTPTVLEDGLINLKVIPEVSELSQSGTQVFAGGQTSIFPSFTVRRASTTVQLHDGQSFAIAGLIKNNVTATITRFPILGDIPILGALFRSSEFQNNKTELLFVITPRLVKPLPPNYALPTDSYKEPNRKEFFLDGKFEGTPAEPAAPAIPPGNVPAPQPGGADQELQNAPGGFEMK